MMLLQEEQMKEMKVLYLTIVNHLSNALVKQMERKQIMLKMLIY